MASPFSREQANEHIREIRRRKNVDNLDGQESDNMRDLDRTLNILSDQLYEKETHFLLELTQNADDNTFDEVTPSISFTCNSYNSQWTLEIECNEVGFKQENVEALCHIGDSTKRADQRTHGFIGEKGIGFKSVFKVANIVRIHSKAYSFMLDRRERLGMIAPIVDRSPWQVARDDRPETHMLLELNSESESRIIFDELVKLEPQILIFLRKISKLHITTPDRKFQFEIKKLVEDQTFDGKETVTLTSMSTRPSTTSSSDRRTMGKKYMIVRYLENLLSTDTRRVNVRETEVVLAFPVDSNMRPLLQSQKKTYAYLPINDYGFNYLIQGDFLLVANRESVDSSRWNDKVLEAVVTAFVSKAVPRFNEIRSNQSTGVRLSGGLRYTWPLYLRDGGGSNVFWCRLNRWIFAHLATAEVLVSRYNGQLCRPGTLYYIPRDYRTREMPLVEDDTSAKCHLSFAYDAADASILPILYRIGVKNMGINDLVRELRELVAKNGISYLETRSRRWHAKMAELLRHQVNRSWIADIPLIPLRDGRWVPFVDGHIFLEEDTLNSTIPGGLDIRLVQAEACQDPSRKAFFQWLGIKNCDRAEVCRMILERYSPLQHRTLVDAVDDVIYLFQTPRSANIPSIRDLLLLQASTTLCFKGGHDLYVEEPDKTSIISKFADHPASEMRLLHPSYITKARAVGRESEFVSWICSSLGVSTKPRLVDPQQRLTSEFRFLSANASKDLLLLLRESWDTYASQLEPMDSRLNKALSEMKVLCTDGQMHHLGQTVLPREVLIAAGPNLFFVDIPDADDHRWKKLTHLGVLCSRSVTLYRRQLKALARLPVNDTTTKSSTEAAYAGLQSSMSRTSVRVKRDFETHRLIVNPELNRWVDISECIWSGPRLSMIFDLSSQYPEYEQLFQRYLELGNVDTNHIVRELCARSTTHIERLKELLVLLSKYLKDPFPQNLVTALQGIAIFPVRTLDGTVVSMRYYDIWYIADRPSLRASFSGELSLLDFDVETVRTLQPLIIALDKTSRLLSIADEPKLEKIGTPIYHVQKTIDLRLRAVYFASLVTQPTFEDKAHLLHSLRTLQVWVVPEVRLIHKVHGVLGVEEKGSVVFNEADNTRLDIYISCEETTQAIINHELSHQFIQYCGIPNDRYLMVEPILSYPLEELRRFLDEHGLEEPLNRPDTHMNDPETNTEVNEDEGEDEVVEISRETFAARRTPNSSRTTFPPEPDLEVSRPPSLLGERVPQSNGIILSVGRATALPSTRPSSFGTLRERTNHAIPVLEPNTSASSASSSGARPSLLGEGVPDSNENSVSADRAGALPSTATTPLMTPSREQINGANPGLGSNIDASLASFSRRRSERSPAQQRSNYARQLLSTVTDNDRRIGLLGERFINDWLSQELQDGDPTRHWTSKNRNHVYTSNRFIGNEGDYADFTYADTRGNLTSLLSRCGYIQDTYTATWLRSPPTYHLEVKSTTASCNEPFYMSNNQVEKSRGWTFSWISNIVPQNVYVLIRVYNLERQIAPGFEAYVDPWAMYLRRELSFFARGDYAVTASTNEMDLT